jgi:hypothetical protein
MKPFNPRPFSFSSIKKFETCPRQYAEIVVYRNFQDVFTSAKGEYGDKLHKSADAYVQRGGEIDNEFQFLQPTLDALREIPGEKLTEHKMAVLPDGSPTRWNDPDRWFQGIADLCIVSDKPTAYCLDYKTGDVKYADTDQLELMAMLMFAHYPHVTKVKGRLLFVLSQQPRDRTVLREENERLWQKWREKDARRVAAIAANNFPPKESGLCKKHCQILTCEHNGRR